MGMAGLIIGTIGAAFLQGRAAREQAEAQARQAEAQASQYEAQAKMQQAEAEAQAKNAERANKQAEEQARIATEKTDRFRTQAKRKVNEQIASAARAGLVGGVGSPAAAIADTMAAVNYDTRAMLNNEMQASYKTSGMATDYSNESNKYDFYARQNQANAEGYRESAERTRAAGKRAEMNAWLGGVFSLASNLSGFGGGGGNSGSASGGGQVLGNHQDGYQLSSYASGTGSWGSSMNGLTWNNAYSRLPKYAQPKTFF